MGVNLGPPKRNEKTVNADGSVTLRTGRFFEDIATFLATAADPGTAVSDLPGGADLSETISKINELLTVLRIAGVIQT